MGDGDRPELRPVHALAMARTRADRAGGMGRPAVATRIVVQPRTRRGGGVLVAVAARVAEPRRDDRPAALAWLVCGATLFALGRERPTLLAPALLALGLSVGVKTTTLPLALVVAAIGLTASRGRLRPVRAPLLAALGGALAVGGVWYVRDLVDHGSPFWPVLAAPWGDPVPHWIELVHSSFLDRPGATIDRLGASYLNRFGGGLLLLAAGVLAPLAGARRRTLVAGIATALGVLIWMGSPLTGVPVAPGLEESVIYPGKRGVVALGSGGVVGLEVVGFVVGRGEHP